MRTLRERYYRITEAVMTPVARTGIRPNHLTIASFLLTAGVAVIIATGNLVIGGVLTLIVSALDSLDGSLARVSGQVTRFGGFLDSSLDRYSDALLLAALYPAIPAGDTVTVFALFAALAGSFAVSYTKARANANGIECDVGLFPREVRIVVYALGLITGLVVPMIWILALFANITALQRIIHVYRATRRAP